MNVNRFKGLSLIDRVPDEIWTEVQDIVQESGIKTIPKEKKCKKAKWLSEGGLTNSCEKKRSERQRRKGKIYSMECGVPETRKERQESLRSEQCREIEENNKWEN